MPTKIYLVGAWRDGTDHLVYTAKSTREKAEKFIEDAINNLINSGEKEYEGMTFDDIEYDDGYIVFGIYDFYIREMEVD